MRKAREEKAKVEDETVEGARAWEEAKSRDKKETTRVNADARDRARAKVKTRVKEETNDIQREAAETATKIRVKGDAKRAK